VLVPDAVRAHPKTHHRSHDSLAERSAPYPILRTSLWALLLLLGGSLALHLFTYSSFVVDNDLDHQRDFNDGYKVFSLTLPNELIASVGKRYPWNAWMCASAWIGNCL
jgi:hypothetical protein